MLKIAICDDEETSRAIAQRMCEQFIPRFTNEGFALDVFTNPVDMLTRIEENGSFDLILCDVYMPGLLGTEAIKELRDAGDKTHVIFMTSSQEHAVEAFALHVDNYLVKPLDAGQVADALKESITTIQKTRAEYLALKTRTGMIRVEFSDLCFIQTDGNYQAVHLNDGSVHEVRSTNKELYSKVSSDPRFFKAGSSYIINMDMVRTFDGADAHLVSGECITIPSRLQHLFEESFFEYTMGAF